MTLFRNIQKPVLYIRVSLDKRKRRSVTQQDKACREELIELGIDPNIAAIYDDNNKSASGYAKKRRDDWERLLVDLAADKIDFIIMWESSRGGRDDLPWIQFLRLCRDKAVLIHVVKDHRTYDVSRRQDYRDLAKQGIDNADYSSEASERVLRDKQWIRDEGLPDGRIPFGWTRDYDPKTGHLLRQRPDPEKVPLVACVLNGIVEGKAVQALSKETGQSRQMIRRIALHPAHISRRYKAGTTELDPRPGNWGVLYPGVEDVWWKARRILLDPERKTTKPGKAKYLMSYIAISECLGKLNVRRIQKNLYYTCLEDQCVGIKKEWLDKFVNKRVIDRFCEEDIFTEAIKADDAEVLAARAEAAELQATLDDMWSAVKADRLPLERYTDAEVEFKPRIEAATKRATEAGLPPQLRIFASLNLGGDPVAKRRIVAAAWKAMPMSGRRDVVRLLFDHVQVLPTECGRSRGRKYEMDESRVHSPWRKSWT